MLDGGVLSLRQVALLVGEEAGLAPVKMGRVYKRYPNLTAVYVQLDSPVSDRTAVWGADEPPLPSPLVSWDQMGLSDTLDERFLF